MSNIPHSLEQSIIEQSIIPSPTVKERFNLSFNNLVNEMNTFIQANRALTSDQLDQLHLELIELHSLSDVCVCETMDNSYHRNANMLAQNLKRMVEDLSQRSI
jgi:hypothetical protein